MGMDPADAAQILEDGDDEHEQRQQLDSPSAPEEALPRPAVRQHRPQKVLEERPPQPGPAPHRPLLPHPVCFHRARQKVDRPTTESEWSKNV